MSPAQEAHLEVLKNHATALLDEKYRKGQAEHGGNLFDLTPKQLALEAIMETIDLFTYQMTLYEKLSELSTEPELPKQA